MASRSKGHPMTRRMPWTIAGTAVAAAVVWPLAAQAQPAGEFFKGRTISIITSTGAGGPYDLAARTVARHMPRHIPGAPTMVVKNMPGGGHTLASNYLAIQAPRDGTTIATISNTIPLHQVLDGKGVRYDARKFNWLGTLGISSLITVAWATSGIKSIDDVMRREVITGATGAGSGTWLYPNAMNVVLGTKFKIVTGYTSSAEVDLAMLRGEVTARSGGSYIGYVQERPEWLRENKVNILVQVGAVREKELPDVPLMHELAKSDEQRRLLNLISSPVRVGRPYLAPPDVPGDRIALLRKAFDALMQDAAFLAEAKGLALEVNPLTGDKVAAIVDETVNAPAEILAKARAMVGGGESPGSAAKQ